MKLPTKEEISEIKDRKEIFNLYLKLNRDIEKRKELLLYVDERAWELYHGDEEDIVSRGWNVGTCPHFKPKK